MPSFCRADSLFVEQLLDKNLVDRKPARGTCGYMYAQAIINGPTKVRYPCLEIPAKRATFLQLCLLTSTGQELSSIPPTQ